MNQVTTTIAGDDEPLILAPLNDYGSQSLTTQLLGNAPVLSESVSPISRYHATYEARVNAYQTQLMQRTGLIHPPTIGIVDHTFFRRQYQALLTDIHQRKLVKHWQEGQTLSTTMVSLLGEEGLALCRLAIEEETHSLAYRQAMFAHATGRYSGEPWTQQPGIIIAGPSGSGKSHAAASIIGDITGSQRTSDEHAHNFLVTVDGEYSRSTSHVFNDTIALAKTFGFQYGVADLHDKTHTYTGDAKRVLREAAFLVAETGKAGFIMPETFTDYFATSSIRRAVTRFIKICKNPKINPIFVDIEANQDAVRHDAEARAKIQSKAYNTRGFSLSEFCSNYVKNQVRKKAAHHVNFVKYTNDRILVKPHNNTWVEAKYGAKGAMPVSRRVYQSWIDHPSDSRQDLRAYVQQQHTQALLHFGHVLRARQQLKHYVASLKRQPETEALRAKIAYFNQVLQETRAYPTEKSVDIVDNLVALAKQLNVENSLINPITFFTQQERTLLVTLMQALISHPNRTLSTDLADAYAMHQNAPTPPKNQEETQSVQSRAFSNNFVLVFDPSIPDRLLSTPLAQAKNNPPADQPPFIHWARDAIATYYQQGLVDSVRARMQNLLEDVPLSVGLSAEEVQTVADLERVLRQILDIPPHLETMESITAGTTIPTEPKEPAPIAALIRFESRFFLNDSETEPQSIRFVIKQMEGLKTSISTAMSLHDTFRHHAIYLTKINDFFKHYQQAEPQIQTKYKKLYDRALLANHICIESLERLSPSLTNLVEQAGTLKQHMVNWDDQILGIHNPPEKPSVHMAKANYPAYIREKAAQAQKRLTLAQDYAGQLKHEAKRLEDANLPSLREAVDACRQGLDAQLTLLPSTSPTTQKTIKRFDTLSRQLEASTTLPRQGFDRISSFFERKTTNIRDLQNPADIARYRDSHTHIGALHSILLALQLELADFTPSAITHTKADSKRTAKAISQLQFYQQQLHDLHLLRDDFTLNTKMPGLDELRNCEGVNIVGKDFKVLTRLNELIASLTPTKQADRALLATPPGLNINAAEPPLSDFTREFCEKYPSLSKLAISLERSARRLSHMVGIGQTPPEQPAPPLPPLKPKTTEKTTASADITQNTPEATKTVTPKAHDKDHHDNDDGPGPVQLHR